jgi:excisionase family DNA binding protein
VKTEKFYTVKTLAERLAVKPLTIYRLVDQGKLPAVRIGRSIRFDPEAIASFLDSVRVGPGGLKEGDTEKQKIRSTEEQKG